jgi:hypothetical protein
MENKKFKIGLFVALVIFIGLGLFDIIPPVINNIIYGVMAVIGIAFLFLNRKQLGLNDILKPKEEEAKKEIEKKEEKENDEI